MAKNLSTVLADRAVDLVAAWDANELVPSIEMGGLGPSYEQAIQILVMELLRGGARAHFERIADDWSSRLGGLSGGQVGAAKSLAAAVLKRGMQQCRKEVPADRHILITKTFPGSAPEAVHR